MVSEHLTPWLLSFFLFSPPSLSSPFLAMSNVWPEDLTCGYRKYQRSQVRPRATRASSDVCDRCCDRPSSGRDPPRGKMLKAWSWHDGCPVMFFFFLLKECKGGSYEKCCALSGQRTWDMWAACLQNCPIQFFFFHVSHNVDAWKYRSTSGTLLHFGSIDFEQSFMV